MRPLRIALISHQWPGARMGGIGSYVRQCAAALALAGHDAHVFTFTLPDDVSASIPPGVTVHEIPDLATRVHTGALPGPLAAALGAGGEGMYRLALGQLLCDAFHESHRDRPFDIVEAPEVEALGLPLLLAANVDVPVVTHLHCCTAIARLGNDAPASADPLVTALEFAAIQLADAVCAPTSRVVELTRSFVPVREDVRIIPHPFVCPAGEFTPPPPEGPILFVGRLERLKGVEPLIDALNLFLPRNPAARARLVGPDTNTAPGGRSMRQHLLGRLHPDLHARVEFPGELPRAAIEDELRRASFCVMPSLWENFSMAVCEAMAAGRATIVAAGTGSMELVADDALVAERGSGQHLAHLLESLHRDRSRLLALSKQAHAHVRRLCDPRSVSAQRASFYEGVIARFRTQGSALRAQGFPSAAFLPALGAMTAALTGTGLSHPVTPGGRLLAIMAGLQRQSGRPAEVALYGAGKHTARLLAERHLWESRGHRVVSLIDDHPRFHEVPMYLDLPVQSVDAARAAAATLPPIVLRTDTYEDQFWQQTAPLRAAGVPVHRLY